MRLLSDSGWLLQREKPCRFATGRVVDDWCGATAVDGSSTGLILNHHNYP